jgi:hypothetical protein
MRSPVPEAYPKWLTSRACLLLAAASICTTTASQSAAAQSLLVSGLHGSSGSTVGPGGDLYVTDAANGTILKVDPDTGETTVVGGGLPVWVFAPPPFGGNGAGLGGAIDVAFLGNTMYALVTLVDFNVGGNSVTGIYRVDGPNDATPIADIGTFSMNNPPTTGYVVPTGLQYALETYRGGFLVTDGHHNRVLRVTRDGEITEFMTFGNIVPTGLAVSGNSVYVAEAGPAPHEADDGKVVVFEPGASSAAVVASGAPLLVDVEFGRGRKLFALAQGQWDGVAEGSPAFPATGYLVEVNDRSGHLDVIANLDSMNPLFNPPTSLEIIGNTAYIVTLETLEAPGAIWKLENIAGPPYGAARGHH